MQRETKILFEEESGQVLSNLTSFDKSRLRPTQTVVKNGVALDGKKETFPDIAPLPSDQPQQLHSPEREVEEKKEEEKKEEQGPKRGVSIPMKAKPSSMHGRLGDPSWDPPLTIFETDEIARPGYNEVTTASEFFDQPQVLREKVKMLAEQMRKSKRMCAYTGAGLSTASGISDYASKGDGNVVGAPGKPKSYFDAKPTLSHYVLTSLHSTGRLKHWVQQNHDGLPQKAGYPQKAINEIHGSWYDPSNPVVMMAGQLRGDLFDWLLEWENDSDLLLVLGTSLSGMNADRMVSSSSKRAARGEGFGAVIVSLQRTPMDSKSSLRFFATIDQVLGLLAEELQLSTTVNPSCEMVIPEGRQPEPDVFLIPYDEDGNRRDDCLGENPDLSKFMRLDLREDAVVHITTGQFQGDKGVVMSKHEEGHFRIQFRHNIGKGGKIFMAPMLRTLGWWWVDSATRGEMLHIPVVSKKE